ncbi:hypothetical protein [Nocardia jiangxiensis]|uniref:hypothetical protein n=1 Tax=Nocardia jiangxiensis TaxID=282685 RepID=UPI0002DE88BB|nr:hypothetical protein [Nocardia jiangxiensis]
MTTLGLVIATGLPLTVLILAVALPERQNQASAQREVEMTRARSGMWACNTLPKRADVVGVAVFER